MSLCDHFSADRDSLKAASQYRHLQIGISNIYYTPYLDPIKKNRLLFFRR